MRKLFYLLMMAFLSVPLFAQMGTGLPVWKDMIYVQSDGNHFVNSLKSDGNYNYAAASFAGKIVINNQTFESVGLRGLLLFKFNDDNSVVWQKVVQVNESFGTISPYAVNIDSQGNVLVAANFNGSISDSTNFVNSSQGNTILIKFNATGNVLWAVPMQNYGTSKSSIAFDQQNNIYFNNKSSSIVKISAAGQYQWSKDYPDMSIKGLAVMESSLFVAGNLVGGQTYSFDTTVFSNLTVTSTGFIAKADLNGNFIAAKKISSALSGVNDIVLDNNTRLLFTGVYSKDFTTSNSTDITQSSSGNYLYVAAADMNLNVNVLKSSSSASLVNANAIYTTKFLTGKNRTLHLAGINIKTFQLGNQSVNATGSCFTVKMDTSLNAVQNVNLPFASLEQTNLNNSGNFQTSGSMTNDWVNFQGNLYIQTLDQSGQNLSFFRSMYSDYGVHIPRNVIQNKDGGFYAECTVKGNVYYPDSLIVNNHTQTVISRHNANSDLMWLKVIDDISVSDFGTTFVKDHDGNLVYTGMFNDQIELGAFTLTENNTGSEVYVCKISPDGNILWAKTLGNGEVSANVNVTADQVGNVIVAYVASPNNVLIKYDAQGNKLWTKSMPMESYYLNLVSADSLNNIYMASEIHLDNMNGQSGTIQIDNLSFTQTKNDAATVLFKFTPDGTAVWAKAIGGNMNYNYTDGWPTSLKTDAMGNAYIWGWCREGDVIGDFTVNSPMDYATSNKYNYFLSKINTSGEIVWTQAVYERNYGFNYGNLLELDPAGNVYVAGSSRDMVSVAGNTFSPEGVMDSYIFKFSNDGTYQWTKKIAQDRVQYVSSLSSVNENEVLVTGGYTASSIFDEERPEFTAGSNFYIGKISEYADVHTRIYANHMEVGVNKEFEWVLKSMSGTLPAAISYQFTLYYNPSKIEFTGHSLSGTSSVGGNIAINNNQPGVLFVSYMNENQIPVNGDLLKLKFKALEVGEAYPYLAEFYFNAENVWDVYNLGGIHIVDNLLGDVDKNNVVQAYDAALTLQYSVGMDPMPWLDPLPWEADRLTAANVDFDENITANDAALILQYSAHLIQSFNNETDSSQMKSPALSVNDVTVEFVNNEFVFKSFGNVIGLNVFGIENQHLLASPVISNQVSLKAFNKSNNEYAIGIVNLNALPDGTELLRIPVTDKSTDYFNFKLIINNTEKTFRELVISGNDEMMELTPFIYPNPAIDQTTINNLKPNASIEVYDLSGKLIYQKTAGAATENISVDGWNPGIYTINIISDNKSDKIRFIKK